MELSFPDVLVSSVLAVMEGVRDTFLRKRRPTTSGLRRVTSEVKAAIEAVRKRQVRKQALETRRALDRAVVNLQTLKHMPNDRTVEWTRTVGANSTIDALGSVKIGPAGGRVGASSDVSDTVTAAETVLSSKEEYLERSLGDFRALITRAGAARDGGFVFLDEFYRVDREDQPRVLGYMHRLVKDTGLWLKVGSVRY